MSDLYIPKKIFQWHKTSKRDFPWRHTKDPYNIMIAEFMLHRTRAEQVVPIYIEFIKKYPDLHSLADADERDIKEVTRHLGLHWRADHFIRAARFIVDNYDGKFPENIEWLLKIPGVGDYVSGAILAVCFNKPAPVVDSNIARFINRYYCLNLPGEIRRKKEIVHKSKQLFQCDNPGDFLFALIDFTSLVCKPLNPSCGDCALEKHCHFTGLLNDD
ncbi:MAG: DNA glycosylase [Halobacteriota archaeon]|nr:DNA glycosylase [Halobacteriota archaeon]